MINLQHKTKIEQTQTNKTFDFPELLKFGTLLIKNPI